MRAVSRHYLVMNALRLGPLAATLGLLATLASPARAGTVAGLSYRVPGECPVEAAFVAAVAARGGNFDRLRSVEASRSLEISIEKHPTGFRGSLQVRAKDGDSDAREVYAEGCAEVVNGLAVVTAIALGGPETTVPASAEATPRADAASAPPAPTPAPPDDSRLRSLNLGGVDSIRVGAGTLGVNAAMTYSLSGGLAVGVIPSVVMPRYDLSISRANFVTPPDGRHYLVGNVVRVRVSWLGDATYRSVDTSTRLYGFSFGIDLCAAPVYDRRGLILLACVEYAGAAMNLETHEATTASTTSKTDGFGTVGLNAELQYNLGAHLHLDLRAGTDFALSPLTAERADGSQIFRSQPFSGFVVAGAGLPLLMAAPRAFRAVAAGADGASTRPVELHDLFRTHYASIWRLLRRLGVRPAQLDDAAQEVFWVAARRLADIRSGSESSFLYGVALRIAAHETRRERAAPPIADVDALSAVADLAPSPEEQLDARRARRLLDWVLDRMPLELRAVFVLFELEGLEVREIAALHELPVGTASSRLRRAREEFSALAKRARATFQPGFDTGREP